MAWRAGRAHPRRHVRFGTDRWSGFAAGASCSRFSAPDIWWPSATWTPATGRPRSPAARNSATRCSRWRCSPTSWRSCCSRSAPGSASAPGATWRRPAAIPTRAGCRSRYGCSAEIAITATDLAEVIGTAIGLNLLFHIPLAIGVMHHRARRVSDPGAAGIRLSLDRGLRRGAARRDRGVLRGADRAGRSRLGGCRRRLRADRRHHRQSATCSISRSASSARP